jgi:hypothetical protein
MQNEGKEEKIPSSSKREWQVYIYRHTYIHTYIHIHIYMYDIHINICVCVCVCMCVIYSSYRSTRSTSRLVPMPAPPLPAR